MLDAKPFVEIRVTLLALAFVTAMAALSAAGPRPSVKDEAVHYQDAAGQGAPADLNAADNTLQLAMNGSGEQDRRELQELLAVLEEETEVATKTKMNNDFVPGMVTVLHGEQLEALGIHTIVEALSMVPGIQAARLSSGEPTVKIRGLAFPFNAGNVKVMLNSIALSRESSGINSSVLLTPIAQVDRIEVIRGPGSNIYGDFALGGVVNIVTKNAHQFSRSAISRPHLVDAGVIRFLKQ